MFVLNKTDKIQKKSKISGFIRQFENLENGEIYLDVQNEDSILNLHETQKGIGAKGFKFV
jgi:hypothetical protein